MVLGISSEDVKTQVRFKSELKLPFHLLADPQYQAIDRYGGREENRIYAKPAAFVIGPTGRVKWSYIGNSPSDRPPIQLIMANF